MSQKHGAGALASVGIDAGTSLVKLAIEHPSGDLHLEKFVLEDRATLLDHVAASRPGAVGLTGGGAAPIQQSLGRPSTVLNEFSAWAAGARRLLAVASDEPPDRYLLVSLGTGTSIQLVEGSSAQRIGGTALGGGTLLGLGRLLTGAQDFTQLVDLAARGSRRAVDLVVSEVHQGTELPLADHMTASSFGKLARDPTIRPEPADAAAGVIHLVAENVGLIIGQLADANSAMRVLIGGTTLVDNPLLANTLLGVLSAFGCQASILADGEYTGALGAIELLREQP